MAIPDLLSRRIDPAPLIGRLLDLVYHRPLAVCLAMGTALRIWVYLQGRSYWMDEGSLLGNLVGRSPWDFSGPLTADQLAPPGFLAAERLMVGLLGDSPYVTRLIPMACGIAALWLFRRLVERLLAPTAAIVAMILFSFSDDLVYYANELKPYSTDLAIALAITSAAVREHRAGPDAGRRARLAALAIASPWFSFPSTFVVAGCGLPLIIAKAREGRWSQLVAPAMIAAAWGASALTSYRISSRLLGPSTSMYVFWNFAFPTFPPTRGADLAKTAGILLETLVTPLNLIPTVLPYAFALLALWLALRGTLRIAKRRGSVELAILMLPAALALTAAVMHRYPFHGRLILWTAPAFFMLIAEGAGEVRYRRGRAWSAFVLALLLTYPVCDALYQAVPPHLRDFNPHGDLRRNRFMD